MSLLKLLGVVRVVQSIPIHRNYGRKILSTFPAFHLFYRAKNFLQNWLHLLLSNFFSFRIQIHGLVDSLGGEEVQVGFVDCNRISIFEGIHTSNWAQPLYHTKALTSCHLNLTNSIFLHSSCFCGTLFNSIIFNELKAQSISSSILENHFWKKAPQYSSFFNLDPTFLSPLKTF